MCTSRFKASGSLDVRICIHPFQRLAWAISLRAYPSVWVIRIVRSIFCSISIHRKSVSIEAGTPCVPVPFFFSGKIYRISLTLLHDYAALSTNQCDSKDSDLRRDGLAACGRPINFGHPQMICSFMFHFLVGMRPS